MPDSTWDLISKRVTAMQPFYDQVDKTRKRLNMAPFKMIDPLTKAEMDDVVIVNENRSGNYVTRIAASLMSSKWQTVIEGLTERESHKIEMFIDDNLKQADEYILHEYGLAGLDPWLCNHVCHTSLIGVQWMCYIDKDGNYKIHARPLDMRWTPLVLNKWAAPMHYLDKDDLLQQFEGYERRAKEDKSGITEFKMLKPEDLKDRDNEARDYWDSETGELWVNQQLVFKQKNIYGEYPFVFVWPPSGYMFRDKGYLAHESPPITWLNEELYDQLSRQLSIDATLGFNVLNPRYEKERENLSADGTSEPVPKRGESLDVLKGERHVPVPDPDINRAELASREQVSQMVDEAAPMSPRSYSTPPSAIEVTTEVELLGELQNPRVIALQVFREQLARLIIKQYTLIAGQKSIAIGKTGRQHNFSISDLKDPKKYTISFQLMRQNKRLAIVNESRALAAWGKFPMKYIIRDILGVEDPDGWTREMELEKAKALNPAIGLGEMAVRYAEEAEELEGADKDLKNWESMMLVHEYVMLMRQSMQPTLPAETQNLREAIQPKGNANALIALTGKSAAGPALPTRGGIA